VGKKNKSGSRKKSSTTKYRKRQKQEKANREARQELVIHRDIERIHTEAEFSERNFAPRDAALVCPLCNQPITEEDEKNNIHLITIDHKKVTVHKTCPGEA